MKKILVVDDTPANLDAAKKFFSKKTDFEVIYTTNRKEAEKYLKEVDIVFTDRALPFDEKTVTNFDETGIDPDDKEVFMRGNGYYILFEALTNDKKAIMISDHGGTGILIDKQDYLKDNLEGIKKALNEMSSTPSIETYNNARKICDDGTRITEQGWMRPETEFGGEDGIFKTEIAWNEMCKHFKFNEKPTEFPKIPMK